MLAELHGVLTRLLYTYGDIRSDEVDVRFEMPTREWIASLTRPTIDLYLFGIEENTELRQTAMQTVRGDGHAWHRMPPRRFDLSYLVSAPTTIVADEHVLLWRALATLLKHSRLPDDVLPESLRALEPPLIGRILRTDEGPRMLDVWTALETPPRPALLYVITAPLDLDVAIRSPLVLTRTARYARIAGDATVEVGIHLGGVVRDRDGRRLAGVVVSVEGSAAEGVVTDARGEFVLADVPAGRVDLRVMGADGAPRKFQMQVPSDSYVITLD